MATAVAALLAVGSLAFVFSNDDRSTAGGASAEFGHVHGLGVDPADGTLYAGTHVGLYRLPTDAEPTRVADREQDFMGFAVAGEGRFLASGHPGPGQDGPSSVGLIESTDAGKTWRSRSLAGEADFHALEYRHGRVYGTNALTGELMVSEDMTSWETRSNVPMADFAVSPQSPDVLLATTERGPVRSFDGGRTFAPLPDAPLLMLVSWAEDGTLVGVAPDGSVHLSADAQRWQARGSLDGAPEALVAADDGEIYAAVEGTVVASTDGGRTFSARLGN